MVQLISFSWITEMESYACQRKIDCFKMNQKKDYIIKEMGRKCVFYVEQRTSQYGYNAYIVLASLLYGHPIFYALAPKEWQQW